MRTTQYNQTILYGLSILEGLIEDLTNNIKLLEQSRDFNTKSYKIKKNRVLVSKLLEAYDSLAFLKMYDVWVQVEQIMNTVEANDKQISGFLIRLRFKSEGNDFALINIS